MPWGSREPESLPCQGSEPHFKSQLALPVFFPSGMVSRSIGLLYAHVGSLCGMYGVHGSDMSAKELGTNVSYICVFSSSRSILTSLWRITSRRAMALVRDIDHTSFAYATKMKYAPETCPRTIYGAGHFSQVPKPCLFSYQESSTECSAG